MGVLCQPKSEAGGVPAVGGAIKHVIHVSRVIEKDPLKV
jgi:hypothetical protein